MMGNMRGPQIAERYRAWRLYVNCFQPSMKLVVSDEREGPIARHDPAKTPLQRVLLSGILTTEKEQEWLALARALDPVRLLKQVEQLQQAVFRCAVGVTPFPHRQPATPVLRFHEHLCQTGSFSRSQERPVERDPTPLEPPEKTDPLAWPRTRRDPFQGEWEYILFCVQAMPELTGGALFRHLQRRTPERYHPGHLRSLQRGLRHLRAALPMVKKLPHAEGGTWDAVGPPRSSAPAGPEKEKTSVSHTVQDGESVPQARPISATPSSEATLSPSRTRLPHVKGVMSRTPETRLAQVVSSPSETLQVESLDRSLARAIQAYLQEHTQANRSPKTLAWHRTALGFLQRYLHTQQMHSFHGLTRERIQRWILWLQETPGRSGAMRTVDTIVTYARSARAFCRWLVHQGLLARSPFSDMAAPKADPPPVQVVEPELFARLLAGCRPPEQMGPAGETAPMRNQALLWLVWEGGLSVSEVCALRVGAVSLHQGIVRLSGPGAKERRIALGPEGQRALGLYLARLSQQGKAIHGEAWLFRTARGDPLTNHAVTLLFARINQRAGMPDAHITPSMLRETFAVRYLQAGGRVNEFQALLGLHDRNSLKRYQQAAGQVEQRKARRRRRRKKRPRRALVSDHS